MSSVLGAFAPASSSFRLILLGASAFLLYGAGRLIMGAVPPRADRPGLRAMLGSAVVLIVSLVAIVAGRPDLGLHLPVACATAALTFGIAALIMGRPLPPGRIGNGSWALVAPSVAIALVGGFGGRLDVTLIGALAAYGIAAILSWREVEDADHPVVRRGPPTSLAMILWIGGIALSGLAAVLVMLGLPALEAGGMRADSLAVSFLLAPAIVVPIFFELLPPCRGLGWNGSVSTLARFALLNLCIVLPIISVVQADASVIRGIWATQTIAASTTRPSTQPATNRATQPTATQPAIEAASADAATNLVFPALPTAALRVDLLVLAGALLLLIPVAAGWSRPGMLEAGALLCCYLLGLLLVMASVWRR